MIAFENMLLRPAKTAGMKIPRNADKYNQGKFPHFYVYCSWQIGRPILWSTSHWRNAEIIAKIPEKKIKKVTLEHLMRLGCV